MTCARPLQDPRTQHTGRERAWTWPAVPREQYVLCWAALVPRGAALVLSQASPPPLSPVSLFTLCLTGDLIPAPPPRPAHRGQGGLLQNVLLIKMLVMLSAAVCATFSLLGCPCHLFNVSSH